MHFNLLREISHAQQLENLRVIKMRVYFICNAAHIAEINSIRYSLYFKNEEGL